MPTTKTPADVVEIARVAADVLQQYVAYSESMRAIGRGLHVSSAYSPESVLLMLNKLQTQPLLTDDQIVDAAKGIRYRRYRETVEGVVEDVKRAIADGEITESEGVHDWLHETIDGHHDVIYTYAAREVCEQSSNDGAYAEEYGSDGIVSDGDINWSRLAYAALMADVYEELGDLDELFTTDDDETDEEEG